MLEFRLRTGYNQRNPSYICAPEWAVEVWDADLGGRRTRHAMCPEYLCGYSLGPIVSSATPLSVSNFAAFHIGARQHSWRIGFAHPYVGREALYASFYAFIRAAQGTHIAAYRDP